MLWLFIIGIILAIACVVTIIVWIRTRKNDSRRQHSKYDEYRLMRLSGWIPLAIGAVSIICILSSCFTAVGTKDVGIVTAFGKPVTTLSNGLHMVAPWSSVASMDAAIQTDNHVKTKEDPEACVSARLANMSVACVDVTIKWRIKESSALSLFQNYRTFDNVRDSLVTRDLVKEINSQFGTFNPMASLTDAGVIDESEYSVLASNALTDLRKQIGEQIEVEDVIVQLVHFDSATQQRLDQLQQQIGQTRVAEESRRTAEAQARANKTLADSVSNDPNVLVSKCYDLLNEMVNKGQQIPTGFSCWPGGSSALVVPQAPVSK